MIQVGGIVILTKNKRKANKTNRAVKKQKTAIIPINGVIINVPFTSFLGIRFDDRYGDTFVYLLESQGKTMLHEFHPDVPLITKDKAISKRELRILKEQVAEYDVDPEEGDISEAHPKNIDNKLKKLDLEVSMFG